jgi:antitoxin MazE
MPVASLRKWGNSLAVRIPKTMADGIGLKAGAEIHLESTGDAILIRAAAPRYSLDQLVSGITTKNVHGETDTGPAVGREVW